MQFLNALHSTGNPAPIKISKSTAVHVPFGDKHVPLAPQVLYKNVICVLAKKHSLRW